MIIGRFVIKLPSKFRRRYAGKKKDKSATIFPDRSAKASKQSAAILNS